MARQTHDREDLLSEGVNLPVRGRLRDLTSGHEWLIGRRAGGGTSVFDGPERVFQFNAANEVRRVYLKGMKLAAHDRRLSELRRPADSAHSATTQRVRLQWTPLDSDREAEVLSQWAATRLGFLDALNDAFSAEPRVDGRWSWETVGEPAEILLKTSVRWLVSISQSPAIAALPNADA